MPKISADKERIIEAMHNHAKGGFDLLNPEDFTDKKLAEAFNEMIEGISKRNNEYLMRINDSMAEIGNNAWLKIMFEVIAAQQESLQTIMTNRDMYGKSFVYADSGNVRAITNIKQMESNVAPCVDNGNEIVAALYQCVEMGEMQLEAAERIKRLIEFNNRSLVSMQENLAETVDAIEEISKLLSEQTKYVKPFLEGVWNLAKSCDNLSLEIFNAGHHMYSISRGIDNARNDMFRMNSQPTIHDELKVYNVDHLVLTWRLYNHMAEYEVLKITQLNNPTGCKFGLWAEKGAEDWVRETEAFSRAVAMHKELHEHAVKCFEAKNASDKDKSLEEFEKTLKSYYGFCDAIEELHDVYRKKGIMDETPFSRYA